MSIDAIGRLEEIRARLASDGRVKVTELAGEFGVSEMTIRRDLDVLAEQGLVRRVRGGATPLGPQLFAERFGRQARAKDRIANKLIELVGDARAIGLDASSTLQRMAGRLRGARDLTVVTNGPECFAALQDNPGVTPLLTGGQLDRRTGSLVGPLATRSARDVSIDVLFVSAAAVDVAEGTFEATLEEAEVKVALADVSRRIVLAADHSKLGGETAVARCLDLARIDVLVTDLDPGDARLVPYRRAVDVR